MANDFADLFEHSVDAMPDGVALIHAAAMMPTFTALRRCGGTSIRRDIQ
ncbi:hypothetical protein IU459_33255 [Nocardia amamiensis]|uniref:Uncharacterized protein n=1 Tax=Nocardia amamiensis TaxID=404578 RepID=A0ABS0D2N3_9NOCA|nr:hypothetical protein [Nocardia amamiensis]MBF6302373.1 hypothetical protein [Nocardia amamiensis]